MERKPEPMRDVAKRSGSDALAYIGVAAGAVAVGALAIGALAIGRIAIGRMAVRRIRLGRVEIADLTVHRLNILEGATRSTEFEASGDASAEQNGAARAPRRRRPRKSMPNA